MLLTYYLYYTILLTCWCGSSGSTILPTYYYVTDLLYYTTDLLVWQQQLQIDLRHVAKERDRHVMGVPARDAC